MDSDLISHLRREAVFLLQPWMCQCLGSVDESPVKGGLSAPLPTDTMRFFISIVARGAIPLIGFLAQAAGM
ncbi:hypothetical protein BB934_32090 (plasmid) [Microvirga ossetica]|uniref:Uncharacterized protein n=1 Tax=Microvirga ossetica TaxID=1882682 RepID=A0A1B2ESB5_9HYPH|nr:hypothetical protein BB934_32090 [Microvirga ossetica]